MLGYSRQAFYQHLIHQQRTGLQHDLVIQQVLSIRLRQPRVGTRKLHLMLQAFLLHHHIQLGRDGLQELLRDNGLLIRRRRCRAPRTTFSDHWMHKYPDLTLGLEPLKVHDLWVSDITYVAVQQGFCYLSLVTDVYSRMIVGCHLDEGLGAAGCVRALAMALRHLPASHRSLIHHSDRGCQYCSEEYVEQLRRRGISISMTQHSDPRENAIAERVNGILKQELLQKVYSSIKEARQGVKASIEIYNTERLHSSVNMLTPELASQQTGKLKRWWTSSQRAKKKKEVVMPAG